VRLQPADALAEPPDRLLLFFGALGLGGVRLLRAAVATPVTTAAPVVLAQPLDDGLDG